MISCWGVCRRAAEVERGSAWGSETEWDRNYSSPVWSFAECRVGLSLLSRWQEWQAFDEREYCICLFSDAQTSDSDVPCLSCCVPAHLRWETVFLALSAKLVNSCMSRQGHETCWRQLWDQSCHMITSMKTHLKIWQGLIAMHISLHSACSWVYVPFSPFSVFRSYTVWHFLSHADCFSSKFVGRSNFCSKWKLA